MYAIKLHDSIVNKIIGVIFTVIITVLLGISTGCQTTRVGMESVVEQTSNNNYAKYLNVHNPRLAKKLQIADVRMRDVGGLLQPNVTLRNLNKYPLQIQYKFAWYDNEGFEVDPEGNPWTPLSLIGHETKTVQATAPNPTVVSFKIAIQ